MPFNGSGTFVSLGAPYYPPVTRNVISSAYFIANLNDVFNGLSNCMTLDGQSVPSNNLPMAGFKLTGLEAGSVAGDSVEWSQFNTATSGTAAGLAAEIARAKAAEALLAPLASPDLTGVPIAPTATPLTNNQQIATTGYTDAAVAVEHNRAVAAETATLNAAEAYTNAEIAGLTVNDSINPGGQSTQQIPSGLIKTGSVSIAGNSSSAVTFTTPFPAHLLFAVSSYSATDSVADAAPYITSQSVNGLTLHNTLSTTQTVSWMAIGL